MEKKHGTFTFLTLIKKKQNWSCDRVVTGKQLGALCVLCIF